MPKGHDIDALLQLSSHISQFVLKVLSTCAQHLLLMAQLEQPLQQHLQQTIQQAKTIQQAQTPRRWYSAAIAQPYAQSPTAANGRCQRQPTTTLRANSTVKPHSIA
jgi:hypothetical protein